MFVLAVLIYPVVLGLLCVGAGLLVDRWSRLPGALLLTVGAALLVGLSQWTTYVAGLARVTPYAMIGVALAGFVAGRRRVAAGAAAVCGRGWGRHPDAGPPTGSVRGLARVAAAGGWCAVAVGLTYVVAVAPVLFAGRVTFASYNVLPDSALHLIGADYLIRHGQQYAHLDLANSYGQYIRGYFGSSYPSGAHTLFGGSAFLVPLPLTWALQPFCAVLLALAAGPAWLLARRFGLRGGWAALAALTVSVPALVYGYALIASIKELVALPLILTLGVLAVDGRRTPRAALPFALVAAGGVSALGVAFSVWALAAGLVLGGLLVGDVRAGRRTRRAAGLFVGVGVLAGLVAAWPTWLDVPGSLRATQAIAATSNPGNLYVPLHPEQIFGTWLAGSYRSLPNRWLTDLLIGLTAVAAVLGGWHAVRTRAYALAAWAGLGLVVWLGLTAYGQTWTDAKLLMLTSPVVVLLAWGGVARLGHGRAAAVVAVLLAGGVLASDEMQYHSTDLAPTARYTELASIDGRFGGGPTLFPDFDEWSLYALRQMDVGGLDFVYRAQGLDAIAPHHGDPVDLDQIPTGAALTAYPSIVTGRDPLASRPPSAYQLLWQGTYYEVWGRRPGAPAAVAHLGLSATQAAPCVGLGLLAAVARASGAQLVAAVAPETVGLDVIAAAPASWRRPGRPELGVVIRGRGRLQAAFSLPRAGVWNVWIRGEIMPTVAIGVDGRHVTSVRAQLRGNVYNPDTLPPIPVRLAAGPHVLTLARASASLAPGQGGSDTLSAIYLTPASAGAFATLDTVAPRRWRTLCGRRLDWAEATVSGPGVGPGGPGPAAAA